MGGQKGGIDGCRGILTSDLEDRVILDIMDVLGRA